MLSWFRSARRSEDRRTLGCRMLSTRNPILLLQVAALVRVENFQAPLQKKERAICPLFKLKVRV